MRRTVSTVQQALPGELSLKSFIHWIIAEEHVSLQAHWVIIAHELEIALGKNSLKEGKDEKCFGFLKFNAGWTAGIIIPLLAVNSCYTLELIKKNISADGMKRHSDSLFFFHDLIYFFSLYLISSLSNMIKLVCAKTSKSQGMPVHWDTFWSCYRHYNSLLCNRVEYLEKKMMPLGNTNQISRKKLR